MNKTIGLIVLLAVLLVVVIVLKLTPKDVPTTNFVIQSNNSQVPSVTPKVSTSSATGSARPKSLNSPKASTTSAQLK